MGEQYLRLNFDTFLGIHRYLNFKKKDRIYIEVLNITRFIENNNYYDLPLLSNSSLHIIQLCPFRLPPMWPIYRAECPSTLQSNEFFLFSVVRVIILVHISCYVCSMPKKHIKTRLFCSLILKCYCWSVLYATFFLSASFSLQKTAYFMFSSWMPISSVPGKHYQFWMSRYICHNRWVVPDLLISLLL